MAQPRGERVTRGLSLAALVLMILGAIAVATYTFLPTDETERRQSQTPAPLEPLSK